MRAFKGQKTERTIFVHYTDSPLGKLFLGATEDSIVFLKFHNELPEQQNRIETTILYKTGSPLLEKMELQLNEYFRGKRREFDLPIYLEGTDFQNKVWKSLMDIHYGETITYSAQAQKIDSLSAIRAVANANGQNPIPIIVPCHRVIGTNGKLTGYSGGLWRKKFLIELEKEISAQKLF
jgi:AraC family transcriptional regulator of adaptative response/methylated-DNA-[protein]-cysteine methyltransferase